jgi:hypothetical protein
MEILPLEQIPQVAEAVSQMFHGANLTFYGEASPLLHTLAPVFDKIQAAIGKVGSEPR